MSAAETGFTVRTFGLRVAVRANVASVLRLVGDRLPPGWRRIDTRTVERTYAIVAPRRPGLHTLYGDGAVVARQRRLSDLLDSLESDLQLFVAERAPRRVFLHAGVVGWRGQAIVLPGHSLSGKSSLVVALVRAGATYYSDEYAVLDAAGRVHPYARPICVRDKGRPTVRVDPVTALGGRAGRGPLCVGLVVFSRYRPRARWRPRTLATGRGVLALLNHALAARRAPTRVLSAVGEMAKGARFLIGARGDAEETARLILGRDWLSPRTPPPLRRGTRAAPAC